VGRAITEHWSDRDLVLLDREEGDLTKPAAEWENRFAGVDTVVHLAADPDPESGFESAAASNLAATINVLRACVGYGVRRVVYASSVWADYEKWRLSDRMTWYAASKQCGEALIRAWAEQAGRPAVCLRIGGFDPSIAAGDASFETLRVDAAALGFHFDEALAWNEPRCTTRYATGRLGSAG
jgi:nucleoside-diphosphate-sugar epimerase